MRSKHFVGVDVGCTNVKLVSKIGENFFFHKEFPTGDNLSKDELIEIITEYLATFHDSLDGMGIAFSGVTTDNKTVKRSTLPCLYKFSIEDFSFLKCKNNIKLLNDSNASTLAGTIEYPNSKVLVGITNGTGIGLGVAINGCLFSGSNGYLGEIYGNYTMTEDGTINKIGRIISGSKIKNISDSEKGRVILYLATLLSQVINFYNPDIIYFSGGGFNHNISILKESIEIAKSNGYEYLTKNLDFVISGFGPYAGAVGATKFVS